MPDVEPLWYCKSIPYGEYRQTAWWKQRRQEYRDSVRNRYGRLGCELCRLSRIAKFQCRYHVHHLTYERLGEEHDDDLMLLCSPCHNLVHYPDSHAAQHWLEKLSQWEVDIQTRLYEISGGVLA